MSLLTTKISAIRVRWKIKLQRRILWEGDTISVLCKGCSYIRKWTEEQGRKAEVWEYWNMVTCGDLGQVCWWRNWWIPAQGDKQHHDDRWMWSKIKECSKKISLLTIWKMVTSTGQELCGKEGHKLDSLWDPETFQSVSLKGIWMGWMMLNGFWNH